MFITPDIALTTVDFPERFLDAVVRFLCVVFCKLITHPKLSRLIEEVERKGLGESCWTHRCVARPHVGCFDLALARFVDASYTSRRLEAGGDRNVACTN